MKSDKVFMKNFETDCGLFFQREEMELLKRALYFCLDNLKEEKAREPFAQQREVLEKSYQETRAIIGKLESLLERP